MDAPANVEVVVTDDAASRTLRVHFIAYNPTPQTTPVKDRPYVLPGLMEDAPMFRAGIQFRDGIRRVQALGKGTVLKKRGNRVEVTVSDVHEVIQCRY